MTAPEARPEDLLARLVRDLPPLFTDEKPVSFDPVQTAYLHALVRPKALQASISVKKEDFFKAIVLLDAFTEIVAGRPTLLDDVGVIVSELERRHEFLDPDLELLVRYAAVHVAKDLGGARFFRKATVREVGKRFELSNAIPAANPAPIDLFDRAVGRMVTDQIATGDVRDALGTLRGRNDLRLAIVCDAIRAVIPSATPAATTALAAGDWPAATLALLESLVALQGDTSLAAYVDAIHARLTGEAGPNPMVPK